MAIIDDLKAIEAEAAKGIRGATDLGGLDQIRVTVTGKKGSLTGLLRQMGKLSPEERPQVGKLANEVRARVEADLERRRHELEHAALEARIAADSVDVTLPGRVPNVGSEHLISQIIEEMEQIFCGMGYTVEDGPYIETSYYNFTALNAPLDHPSRSARDTFYVEDNNPGSLAHSEAHANGESDILLRTQTSGVQAHTMERQEPPIYMICPGTVFCKNTGWLEILGCGMVDPNVLDNCGVDHEKYTGFAFGIGAERVAALRYNLPDLRMLMTGDERFLRQF